jgi:hypothetical protein
VVARDDDHGLPRVRAIRATRLPDLPIEMNLAIGRQLDVTVAVFPMRVSTPARARRFRYLSFQKASSPRKIGMQAAKPMRFHGDGSSRRRTTRR